MGAKRILCVWAGGTMFLMYVDESGDSGVNTLSSKYYILSSLVVHETAWRTVLERLVQFRRRMKGVYGLRQRDEVHASPFIQARQNQMKGIPNKGHRLGILRAYIKELAQTPNISLIHVLVDKQQKTLGTDLFELAWKALIQRFENTLQHKNFPGSANPTDLGIILPDDGNPDRLRHLLRKMRAYNPVPNQFLTAQGTSRNMPVRFIVEDPIHRDSRHSYFVQSVDVTAYFLQQYVAPNKYIRKKGGQNYFTLLSPVLLKQASPRDPLGIVRL